MKLTPTPVPSAALTGLHPELKPMSFVAGLACVVLIGIALRPGIVSMGPLLIAIQRHFGLTHTQAALLTTIPDVLMGALAAPTPWLAYRFGRDRVILGALAVLLLATLARAFAGSATVLLASTVGVGAGIAVAGALIGGFVKAAFPQKAPLLLGIYTAALACGSTLAAGVSGPVAEHGDWRLGAGVWTVPVVIAIAAWRYVETRERRPAIPSPIRHHLPFGNFKAWLIGLYFAANNFVFYSFVAWIVPFYRERGLDSTTAGLILASFTGMFILAGPLAGVLSRSPDRRFLLAAFSALTLTGATLLAFAPGAAPFLFAPVISFGIAGGFSLGMTLPLDNTNGPEEANAWSAFATLVAYLIAATGPLLVGALRDLTGGFAGALWLLTGVSAFMLALTPFLGPRIASRPFNARGPIPARAARGRTGTG